MIALRDLAKYQYCENVEITCNDGQIIIGEAGEVDDEEESGIEEPGITIYSEDGRVLEIGLSEIENIQVLRKYE